MSAHDDLDTTMSMELSNECTCVIYDDETDEYTPADDCDGSCWDDQMECWQSMIEDIPFWPTDDVWRIEGWPTWRGTVSGSSHATSARELLDALTPARTSWRLDVVLHADHLTATLYHHDAPTGGTMTVSPNRL
jgi:hypothetical protein